MTIRLVGGDLYHADGWKGGRTNMTKLIVVFGIDSSAPNKDRSLLVCSSCRLVNNNSNRMFIGPCIIVIVEELETNLMSLVIFITLNICSTCFEH